MAHGHCPGQSVYRGQNNPQPLTRTTSADSPGCDDRYPGCELIRMVTNQPIDIREKGLIVRGDCVFLKEWHKNRTRWQVDTQPPRQQDRGSRATHHMATAHLGHVLSWPHCTSVTSSKEVNDPAHASPQGHKSLETVRVIPGDMAGTFPSADLLIIKNMLFI